MKSVLIFFAILLFPLCHVSLWAGPANDLFVKRTPLAGTNVTLSGINFPEREPNQAKMPAAENILWFYSVWYSCTSRTNGVLYLSGSTTVGNFYMSIRVYRGSAVNAYLWPIRLRTADFPSLPAIRLRFKWLLFTTFTRADEEELAHSLKVSLE